MLTVTTAGAAPVFTLQPVSQTAAPGWNVTFTVTTNGTGVTYQWQKNGTAIAGATSATLTLNGVQGGDAGDYDVVASSTGGQTTSFPASLVIDNPVTGRLSNLSVRTRSGTGGDVLIAGFIINGGGQKTLVIRGTGQTLAKSPFNLTGVLADPVLDLQPLGAPTPIATNDSWNNAPNLTDIRATGLDNLGPVQLDAKDAIIMQSVSSGGYTAKLSDAGGGTGTGLVEVFDTDPTAPGSPGFDSQPKLVNVSARAQVSPANPLIVGFIINGTSPKKLLIRATGSTLALAPFNVPGVLPDPKLQVKRLSDGKVFSENDNWGTTASLAEIMAVNGHQLGGVTLDARDAVLIVTLAPGGYTAIITGVNNGSGVALAEVNDMQ
jgi:hypothetical protein